MELPLRDRSDRSRRGIVFWKKFFDAQSEPIAGKNYPNCGNIFAEVCAAEKTAVAFAAAVLTLQCADTFDGFAFCTASHGQECRKEGGKRRDSEHDQPRERPENKKGDIDRAQTTPVLLELAL
ncbi:MAG TPA: hypothetical protein H9676_01000 [Firmicutes bacterium]|nr:hypothetical protein [Bacillota bacterium]